MGEATDSHKVILMEHELVVDGVTLRETKEMSTVHESSGSSDKVILVHTRMIGDRAYQIRETKEGGKVVDATINTTMSEQEVETFEKEWQEKWQPAISDAQAAQEILPALEMEKNEWFDEIPYTSSHELLAIHFSPLSSRLLHLLNDISLGSLLVRAHNVTKRCYPCDSLFMYFMQLVSNSLNICHIIFLLKFVLFCRYKWMVDHTDNKSGTEDAYVPYSTTRNKIEPWRPGQKKVADEINQ